MDKIYELMQLTVGRDGITFELAGQKIRVSLTETGSEILPNAKLEHLRIFEADDDGIGIYWPVLDEDLSVSGLLRSAGKEELIVRDIPSLYLDETPSENTGNTPFLETKGLGLNTGEALSP